ncbi:hypothetical protein THAR02_05893 [Trichoderma harzianum]|uniref:Uncharacterized protein n=1 Tax=Trichoderma harzianum TaxID=5544 RepID=A0A0F9XP70_TRIHA|nr:hypothetical protein THAR02_05893 [Trichoderma harzianum]
MSPEQMNTLAAKGRAIFQELEQAIDERGQIYTPFPEIAPRYNTSINPPYMPQVGEKLENILKGNGQPSDQYQLVQVKSLDSETPAYYNHVHQDGRVILCMYNFASMDLNKERMHWSDLMAVSASRVMNVNGGSTMEQLEAIWRISIVNDETNGVIDAIDHRIHGDIGRMDEERFFELTTEDGDEFFALLGTVHRKGPARMLAAFPKYFGGKKMVRVRVYPDGSPNLCWFLEKQKPKHDGPLSRKAKRAQKKEMRKSSSMG